MGHAQSKGYWDARLKAKPGFDGVGLSITGAAFNGWMFRAGRRVLMRQLRKLRLRWDQVDTLEVGAGSGFYSRAWKRLGVRSCLLTDISTVAVSRLQSSFPDTECRELDIAEEMPPWLESRRFDLVAAPSVLFHVIEDERYERAFRNIFHVLRPGGFLLFSENFLHGPAVVGPYQVSRPLEVIEGVVRNAGFEIDRRVAKYVLMNCPVDARSQVWQRLFARIARVAGSSPVAGHLCGVALYPLEVLLARVLRESPSTELMICRKPATCTAPVVPHRPAPVAQASETVQ